MEIKLPADFSQNLKRFMGRAGYSVHFDPHSGNSSYVKRLARDYYPRFHVYLKQRGDQEFLNLHLDQKKASYPGASAHNAEYDGTLVLAEANRLEDLMSEADQSAPSAPSSPKGFWSSLFRK